MRTEGIDGSKVDGRKICEHRKDRVSELVRPKEADDAPDVERVELEEERTLKS